MERKNNIIGIIKGLGFPIGYVAFMNAGQMLLTVPLALMISIRTILAMLTTEGIELNPDLITEWSTHDNLITTMKYATFFSVLTTVAALIILWLVFNRKGKSFTEYFRFTKAPVKAIFAAVLLGLSMHFIVSACMLAIDPLMVALREALFDLLEVLDPAIAEYVRNFYQNYLEMMNAMGNDVGMFTVAAVLGAPIIEELVFRAGPLTHFKNRMPGWLALLITSALFGLAHGMPTQIAYTFIVGLVMGLLFIKTDSIYPSIIMHFCFNAANLIPMAIQGFLGGPFQTPTMVAWFESIYVIYTVACAIIAIPMLVVGIILLVKLRAPIKQAAVTEQPIQPAQPAQPAQPVVVDGVCVIAADSSEEQPSEQDEQNEQSTQSAQSDLPLQQDAQDTNTDSEEQA